MWRRRELSDDRIAWSDGMLYPVLRRLEAQGLITSYWQGATGERRRRYYQLEQEGRQELVRYRGLAVRFRRTRRPRVRRPRRA